MKPRQTSKQSGPVFVLLLLAVGLLASGLTWWNYERKNFSTKDAVWVSGGTGSAKDEAPQEVEVVPIQFADAESRESLRLEADQIRGEIRLFQESLEATRAIIEDAVIMVQEQTDNFEFAKDRYESLMPLVETGALEPLAASQIQSAYISARASLAQAKFLLSQARRDFGTSETRVWRYQGMQKRLQEIERLLAESTPSGSGEPDSQSGGVDSQSGEALLESPLSESDAGAGDVPASRVLAVFSVPRGVPAQIRPGMQARVTFPATGSKRFRGIVTSVELLSPASPEGLEKVMARLVLDEEPEFASSRESVAAQVTIDGSLPLVRQDNVLPEERMDEIPAATSADVSNRGDRP